MYEKGLLRTDRGLFLDKGNHRYDPRHPDFDSGAQDDGNKDVSRAFADCDTEATANSAGCFVGPGTYLFSANTTLAADWTLARGAVLKPASGVTVTFSGAVRGEGTEAATFDTSLGGTVTATTKQFGITNIAAPTDAQYVTLTASGDLSAERVLTAGTGITVTDAGAGSTVTIAQDDNSVVQKVEVAKAGSLVGTRKRLNFIEGTNITLTVADDSGDDEVDVTVAATAVGAPAGAQYVALATDATLTDERVLTAGRGVTLTDAGAGSTATIANKIPSASARAASGQSVSASTWTKITLGTEETDTDSAFASSTYTAPAAGRLWVRGTIPWATPGSGGARRRSAIYKNGSEFHTEEDGDSVNPLSVPVEAIVPVSLNDTIDLYAFHNDSGSLSTSISGGMAPRLDIIHLGAA